PGALLLLRRWRRARFQHFGPAAPNQSHLRLRRDLRVGLGGRDPESDDEDDVRRYGLLFDAPDERHAVPDPHDRSRADDRRRYIQAPHVLGECRQLRPGAKFADGTAVTPWDVKYSFTRTMLFVFGDPFTSGWIQSQYLLPSISHADLTFDNVNNAVSVDNTTGNVTFHLAYSVPELL